MKTLTCVLFLAALVGCAAAPSAEVVKLETDDQKTLYALGMAMSQQLTSAGFSEADASVIAAGLADGLLGRTARVEMQVYGPQINGMLQTRSAATKDVELKESQAYCDVKATEAGAVKTASGAIYFETAAGTGAAPTATDSVKVHYHGTLRDGKVFDSSVDRGEPVVFSLNGGVIACFSEGIQKMKVGGKAKLVCPAATAYGDRGSGMIKPGAAISFDVELLEIVAAPPQAG